MSRFIAPLFAAFTAMSAPAMACTLEDYALQGLSQNWPEKDRATWYSLSQGSRLIPLAWYNALTLADQDTRFAARDNQARYVSQFCEGTDLPLGFVVDTAEDRVPALGLTCSACHTGVLDDGTQAFVVEGGASDLDLQGYMTDMFQGLTQTYYDSGFNPGPRWTSFAAEVLGDDPTEDEMIALETEVRDWLQRRYQIQDSIEAGGNWGHGRTDAVAVILNTATVLSGQRAGVVLPPSSAPTSFPYVWNAPQMQRVQWNGSATKIKDIGLVNSIEMGAVTRNLAEVIGVFAEIELTTDFLGDNSTYPSIRSSAKLANLVKLERSMETLKSPAWPDAWGAVDLDSPLYKHGAGLYEENCAACHAVLDRDDLTNRVWDSPKEDSKGLDGAFTKMVPAFDLNDLNAESLGTDPLMACNALTHTSWSGKFEELDNSFGAFRKFVGTKDINALVPEKFEKGVITLRLIEELAMRMTYEKSGELLALQKEDLRAEAAEFFDTVKTTWFGMQAVVEGTGPGTIGVANADQPIPGTHALPTLDAVMIHCARLINEQFLTGKGKTAPAYKARPLNGIFATAPYLHNGSVPTLDDLLKPAHLRPTSFMTGRVRYDPVRMGLGAPLGDGAVSEFSIFGDFGQVAPGNGNGGHDYLRTLSCQDDPEGALCAVDRAAVLEYLKTL